MTAVLREEQPAVHRTPRNGDRPDAAVPTQRRSHRGVVAGRQWSSGGALTLIVWREADYVVVSHEGAVRSTARLASSEAVALAGMLLAAAGAE